MSPEHAAELKKRGIVYKPWPSARRPEREGPQCATGCGAPVRNEGNRCSLCRDKPNGDPGLPAREGTCTRCRRVRWLDEGKHWCRTCREKKSESALKQRTEEELQKHKSKACRCDVPGEPLRKGVCTNCYFMQWREKRGVGPRKGRSCRCDEPDARKVNGKCANCNLKEWRARNRDEGEMRIARTKKVA
jgi:hypothetical protein